MLADIVTLDEKNISTFEYKSEAIDPAKTMTDSKLLAETWSMKTDETLKTTIETLASHTIEMYKLMQSHKDKAEIKEFLDKYQPLMIGLNSLGVIEPDYHQGIA